MRADTNDVAFRLLIALGDLWEGLERNDIDPTTKGLYLSQEYLGGYVRLCAGPAGTHRLVAEWNETTRHLRVLRCEEWPGFEATVASTVTFVREAASKHGIRDEVDARIMSACEEPVEAVRRTTAADAREALRSQ